MLDKVIAICHKEKKDVRIIVETHSEVIVNRLGIKIMDDNSYLKTDDVNVCFSMQRRKDLKQM